MVFYLFPMTWMGEVFARYRPILWMLPFCDGTGCFCEIFQRWPPNVPFITDFLLNTSSKWRQLDKYFTKDIFCSKNFWQIFHRKHNFDLGLKSNLSNFSFFLFQRWINKNRDVKWKISNFLMLRAIFGGVFQWDISVRPRPDSIYPYFNER